MTAPYPHPRDRAPRLRIAAATALALLAFAVAACGDSDDDSGDGAATVQTETTATSDRPADAPPPRSDGASEGPTLLGDVPAARAGAKAVDDVYGDLRTAIDGGIAAVDVDVGKTLTAASESKGLKEVCALMSAEAQRRTIDYVERSAGLANIDWTCEKATAMLLRRTRSAGALKRTQRVTVVGVNAEGDRATATVRFGGRRAPLSTISLVKENGKWKLGTALAADG